MPDNKDTNIGIPEEILNKIEDMTTGDSAIPTWSVAEVPLDEIPDTLDPSRLMEQMRNIAKDNIPTPSEKLIPKDGSGVESLPKTEADAQGVKTDGIPSPPPNHGTDEMGLSAQEKKYNGITAKYGLEIWDQIVKTGSVMVYGLVNNPKEAQDVLNQYEDIINEGKSLSKRQLEHRKSLQEHISEYEQRKREFAFNTGIDAELKGLAKDMTEEVMNAKGIKSDPSLVLLLLFFAPLFINVLRIVMDRIGYPRMI